MAALTAPTRTAAQHQSLLHFVGQGEWSDETVMERIRPYTIPRIERHGAICVWIVDDTGFPKKGKHSAGRGTAVLRTTRQAGQLPGHSLIIACQ
jgi:SRSO17 transposase